MGLAERVLPIVGPKKEAVVAAEPQPTALAGRLNPAEERVARTGFPGRRAEREEGGARRV